MSAVGGFSRAATAALVTVAAAASGCTTVAQGTPTGDGVASEQRMLIREYYDAGNAAAEEGSDAQDQFLDETQHPDYADERCPLEGLTLLVDPALTTLRPDPDWEPTAGEDPPRGTIYVVAVSLTVEQEGVELGNQVGSQHVVILDGTAYGFAPCLT